MLNRTRSIAIAVVGFFIMAIVHTLTRVSLGRLRHKLRAHNEQGHAP
jgi:hypothetical protein